MCKPSVTSEPIVFADGLHGCTHPPVFENLYLFHLRYLDKQIGLARLARTRAIEWAIKTANMHQRVEDDQWVETLTGFGKMPDGPEFLSEAADHEISTFRSTFLANAKPDMRAIHKQTSGRIRSSTLFKIPPALQGVF